VAAEHAARALGGVPVLGSGDGGLEGGDERAGRLGPAEDEEGRLGGAVAGERVLLPRGRDAAGRVEDDREAVEGRLAVAPEVHRERVEVAGEVPVVDGAGE